MTDFPQAQDAPVEAQCSFCAGVGLVEAEAIGEDGSTAVALMYCPECFGLASDRDG